MESVESQAKTAAEELVGQRNERPGSECVVTASHPMILEFDIQRASAQRSERRSDGESGRRKER